MQVGEQDSNGAEADQLEAARQIALRALTGQAYSRYGLARLLQRRGVTAETITTLLDRFEEVGLINDRDFAEAWVQSRQSRKSLSTRGLKAELQRHGIATKTMHEALASVGKEQERAAALDFVTRRLAKMARLEPQIQQRRLGQALARRGFGPDIIYDVVVEALAQQGQDAYPEQIC